MKGQIRLLLSSLHHSKSTRDQVEDKATRHWGAGLKELNCSSIKRQIWGG